MTDKIAGKAIYLELVPKDEEKKMVTQILITPEGFDDKNNYVPVALHSRTVADYSPRKQWRVSMSKNNNAQLFNGTPISTDVALEKATANISYWEGVIKRQMMYDFSLRKTPIVVEVSTIDLAEVKEWKTPPALLRRIQKARVALNFPEKVL